MKEKEGSRFCALPLREMNNTGLVSVHKDRLVTLWSPEALLLV